MSNGAITGDGSPLDFVPASDVVAVLYDANDSVVGQLPIVGWSRIVLRRDWGVISCEVRAMVHDEAGILMDLPRWMEANYRGCTAKLRN